MARSRCQRYGDIELAHHRLVPSLCCEVKAADAVVAREEEEVAAALLDEQLW